MISGFRTSSAGSMGLPAGVLRLDYHSALDGAADWALFRPDERTRMVIVGLHGHGSGGDQFYTRPDLARAWLPLLCGTGCGLLTPNLRGNAWMAPSAAADLRALLQHVRQEYGVLRFVLLGGSMGGTGALIYSVLHPEDVAGVIAVCPATDIGAYHGWCLRRGHPPVLLEIAAAIRAAYGGSPEERPGVYAQHSCLARAGRLAMPVYLAHGDADEIIPVGQSRTLRDALPSHSLLYRERAGGGHDAPLTAAVLREGLGRVLPT
ncbi:MAG: alpha/beta fold hydrolase [Candidatus Brocadiaceae bacterium]|nr:alpha/beta fold hydrolase [Candidatus Brocadiaceae bacterium]